MLNEDPGVHNLLISLYAKQVGFFLYGYDDEKEKINVHFGVSIIHIRTTLSKVFMTIRRMIVRYYGFYNTSLEKDGQMDLSFSMTLSMHCVCASKRNECEHVFTYIA